MNNIQLIKVSSELLGALLEGNSVRAGSIIDQTIESGVSLPSLYVDVICAAQCSIGEMWNESKVTIAQEHRATQIIFDHLTRLRNSTRARKSLGIKVVVTSLPGDHHVLGGRMVADLLLLDGWDVDFFGVDTPIEELVRHIDEDGVKLVGLSVSDGKYFPLVEEAIQKIRNTKSKPKIILGGRGVVMKSEEAKKLGADVFVTSGCDVVKEARRALRVEGSTHTLSQTLGEIGSRIHFHRKAQKMSQEKLAQGSGLDRAYISSVENGKQNITVGALLKLSDALGLELCDLINNPVNQNN